MRCVSGSWIGGATVWTPGAFIRLPMSHQVPVRQLNRRAFAIGRAFDVVCNAAFFVDPSLLTPISRTVTQTRVGSTRS